MKTEINGISYFVGRNAKENWDLFEQAEPYDLWFHLEEDPSCHVFLPVFSERTISREEIIEAGKLCKKYSKIREKKVSIIYSEARYLKKGRVVGEVFVKDDACHRIKV